MVFLKCYCKYHQARRTQRNYCGDRSTHFTSGLSKGSDRVLAALYRAFIISHLPVILLVIIHAGLWSYIEEESDEKPSRNIGVPRILIFQLSLYFLIPVSLQIIVLIKLIRFLLMFHKLQFYTDFFFPLVMYFSSSLSSYALIVMFYRLTFFFPADKMSSALRGTKVQDLFVELIIAL